MITDAVSIPQQRTVALGEYRHGDHRHALT